MDNKSDSVKRLEACLPSDGLVDIVEAREDEKKLKVMMRIRLVMRGEEWLEDAKWSPLMTRILRTIYAAPNTRCFLGKSYFLRGNDMIYGWILCLYSDNSHEDFLVPLETNFGISKREAPPAAPQVESSATPAIVPVAKPAGTPQPPSVRQSLRKPLDRDISPVRVRGAKAQPYNPNTGKGASPINPNARRASSFRR